MKIRLPWLLLIISLAFNLFAAAGFVLAREQAKRDLELAQTFMGRADLLARQLNLDDSQRKVYGQVLDQIERLRASRAPQRDAFFQELVKDNPDQKVLENYFVGPEAQKQRLDRLVLMRKMVQVLTPQQRSSFLQLIRKSDSSSK